MCETTPSCLPHFQKAKMGEVGRQMLLTEVQNAKMGEAGRQMLLAPGSKGENRGGGRQRFWLSFKRRIWGR